MNIEDRKHAEDLDAVSRAYRNSGAARNNDDMMPPAAIDDAIRAAARRAVQAGPQPKGKNWLGRWTPQLAVAAVVVLSVSVVLVSVEERPELAPAPMQKITPTRPSEPRAASNASAPSAIISAEKSDTRAQELAKPSKSAESVRTKVLDQNMASGRVLVPPPELQISMSPLERAKKEDRASAEIDRGVRLASGQLVVPPNYAPRPAPATPVTSIPAAPPAASPFPAGVTSIDARKEARAEAQIAAIPEANRLAEKNTLADAVGSHDSIAKAPKAASANEAPAPTVVASAASSPTLGAGALLPKLKQLSAAEPPRAETTEPRRDHAQAVASGDIRGNGKEPIASTVALAKDSRPGPWLKRLMALREQNKLKELREELARFQKAHPNVVLPKTLTEIAESRE